MLDKLRKLLSGVERENYVEKRPQDVYREIAEKTPLTKEEVAMIGGVESQHGKYEDNMAGSSAKGIMQVMPQLAKVIRPGSEQNLKDRNVQAEIASDFINLNTPTIKEISQNQGKHPDVVDQYLMYNLGQGRGKKFLQADGSTKITDILPAKVIKANPKLYNYKTVGEARNAVKGFLEQRGGDIQFYPDQKDFTKLFDTEEE
jgi:hypothetical protein